MQAITESGLMFAVFGLGGGEIIIVLGAVLSLIGAENGPDIFQGLGRGVFKFRQSSKGVADAVDDEGSEAGRSLGGIYGKPAAQALTSDNQVAELYSPAGLKEPRKSRNTCKG